MTPYFSITEQQIQEMLARIGVKNIDNLFADIPDEIRRNSGLNIPEGMDEISLTGHLESISHKNQADNRVFAGGGIYDHYIPPAIDYLVSRGEFLTAYTPYQPEASQGTLQAVFEYQTMICEITGMDVSNASIYDGATALAEALFMVFSSNPARNIVLHARTVNPHYISVAKTYTHNTGIKLEELIWDDKDGTIDIDSLRSRLNDSTSCVLVQHPNYFGCLEDMDEIVRVSHEAGAKVIVVMDPISLGILKRPGDYGADVAVAEGQPLGMPMYSGGETLGIFACKEEFLRLMPGRLVGQTVDSDGKRGFTLTLQTREQHIRREKATSNICTNQALNALRTAIYLSLVGKEGFRHISILCAKRCQYLREKIARLSKVSIRFTAPVFRETVLDYKGNPGTLKKRLQKNKIVAGPWLGQYYSDLPNAFNIAVTEKRTLADIDALIDVLGGK